MSEIYAALIAMGSSKDWLVVANFILSVLLAMWMLRYRRLYLWSRNSQEQYRDLIDNLSEGVYRSTLDGRQISANKALVRLNGYRSEREMLAAVSDIATEWYVDPKRRDAFREALRREGKVENFVSEVFRHRTRERIWVSESARLVHDQRTDAIFYEGSVREVTETHNRLKLEEQFRKLTSQLPGALFQFHSGSDGAARIIYASNGLERITGIALHKLIDNPALFGTLIAEEDVESFRRSLAEATMRRCAWEHEFRIVTRGGQSRWARVTATPEFGSDGITWHGYLADISVRKSYEMEIEELAFFDPLTKLPNRRLFLKRMAEAVASCQQSGDRDVLLFIDLDNFKTLNDTQGHDTGDAFLVQVASRLRGAVSPRDLVARIGGDEFVVILEGAGSDDAWASRHGITTAGKLLSALREPFTLGEITHTASASVGVVVFDGTEPQTDEILKRADIAMYEAKAAGRNRLALFDPATMNREAERYRLVSDLRHALDRGELVLHFQVQVDHHGRPSGAEVLLRWNHPSKGLILPDRFVSLAEQFGLSDALTRYTLRESIATLAAWQRDPATAHLRLAVNIGAQCFGSDWFPEMLRELTTEHAVDAAKLTLELTEHVMTSRTDDVARRMAEVKALGVRLSLDDFGTGYSSLGYLKSLPLDEIKIDGGFVADIEAGDSSRALVKTILMMARNLGLSAVAEHVENVRQEAFLRAFGCDYLQGHFYGRAVPAAEFVALAAALAARAPRTRPAPRNVAMAG